MKKMHVLFVGLCTGFLLMHGQTAAQDTEIFQSDKLVKMWESPQSLKVPESVCFDPSSGFLYVSNVNGMPAEKDGNGFISKLNLDGTVAELIWVEGLNAPKGMGIANGKLYVTDIDRVAEIDIGSGTVVFYDFPGAQFLNDIAIDGNGKVYVSDMMSARIYRLFQGRQETWLDDEKISGPNGLYVEKNDLLIGCKKIVRADISTGKFSVWLEGTGGIDGLEAVGDGRYVFSDWQGNVYLVNKDKSIEKILDTTPAGINAADIEFIPAKMLLLVPTFGDNRVIAYELH